MIIASCANDIVGYLPLAERWSEGPGYGMPLGQPRKKDLERTLEETAVKLIKEI